MFSRSFNVFIPYLSILWTFLGSLLSTSVFLIIGMLTKSYAPSAGSRLMLQYLPMLVIAFALIFVWWRYGLLPKSINVERGKRYANGHRIIFIANILVVLALLGLLYFMIGYGTAGNFPFVVAPVFMIAQIAWIVGLIMIWTSKQ
jgi:hypothetical protein